jgi:hypothetical protein
MRVGSGEGEVRGRRFKRVLDVESDFVSVISEQERVVGDQGGQID